MKRLSIFVLKLKVNWILCAHAQAFFHTSIESATMLSSKLVWTLKYGTLVLLTKLNCHKFPTKLYIFYSCTVNNNLIRAFQKITRLLEHPVGSTRWDQKYADCNKNKIGKATTTPLGTARWMRSECAGWHNFFWKNAGFRQ